MGIYFWGKRRKMLQKHECASRAVTSLRAKYQRISIFTSNQGQNSQIIWSSMYLILCSLCILNLSFLLPGCIRLRSPTNFGHVREMIHNLLNSNGESMSCRSVKTWTHSSWFLSQYQESCVSHALMDSANTWRGSKKTQDIFLLGCSCCWCR